MPKFKKAIYKIVMNFLSKISGNIYIQILLNLNSQTSQYLMGIGSGGEVVSSGELEIFRVLKQQVQPPYCIFDVGSNKGQFLNLILENVGENDIDIHCFEPGKETLKILEDSFGENCSVKLNNIGLAEEKSSAVLYYNRVGSGLASLTKRRLDHHNIYFGEEENIEINTLDNYCTDNAISHIHLLKIDVEGHEFDVLSGAKNMFASKSIDIVTFEFGGCNIDTRTFFQDFWYYFNKAEYKLYRITPSGYLFPIESYKEVYEQFGTTNFVAVSIG